jgi:hypothetical protein
MSKTLAATLKVNVSGLFADAIDLGLVSLSLNYTADSRLSNGSGANQAQSFFGDQRTLAASASENLDLSGGLTDVFGAAIAFTKIKAILVKASADNVNDVVVGGHGAAAAASFFGDATDKVKVKPGGTMLLIAPDANGYAVTAATGDLLTVANSGAGTGVTYDILIIGTTS